jgi:hypothetical protein
MPVVGPAAEPVSRSYRPGDWFGIFGAQATVVLPPTEKSRVARIWALVDDGAGFDEVLDALIADGLRELPGFVLVSESGAETKVVIRGAAHAEFTTDDGTVTVEGSSATTWAERSLTGVRTMRVDVADAAGDDLLIRDGLVRISRTDRPAYLEVGEAKDDGEATDEGLEVIGGDDVAPDVNVMDETALHPGPAPLPPPSQPESQPEPTGAAAGGRRRDAAHRRPADEPAGACGRWPRRADPGRQLGARRARPQPARHPGQPPAPHVLARPVARLTFSSGEVVAVDRAVIVGRAPEARRFTSTEQPRLITVPSPTRRSPRPIWRSGRARARTTGPRWSPTSAPPTAPCSSSPASRRRTSSRASPSSSSPARSSTSATG